VSIAMFDTCGKFTYTHEWSAPLVADRLRRRVPSVNFAPGHLHCECDGDTASLAQGVKRLPFYLRLLRR